MSKTKKNTTTHFFPDVPKVKATKDRSGRFNYVDENGISVIQKPKEHSGIRYNPYYHSKVLECAFEGLPPRKIAERLGVDTKVIRAWLTNHKDLREGYNEARRQFFEEQMEAIADNAKGPGADRIKFDVYKHLVEMNNPELKDGKNKEAGQPNIQIVFNTGIDRKKPIQEIPNLSVETEES